MSASALDWYAARAAGIVAYLLLTGVVLVGLTLSGKVQVPRWPRFALTDLHRYGGLLVGVFLSIHVLTIAVDTYTPFSLAQLVVPLASSYRPAWVALGIVAAELLVALSVTNVLRKRLPYRLWRRLHYLTFVVWTGAAVHAIGAGTDSRSIWMLPLYVLSISAVVAALAWRTAGLRGGSPALGRVVVVAAVVGTAAVVAVAAAPHGVGSRHGAPAPRALSTHFAGSVTQQPGANGVLLSIAANGTGARPIRLRLDLVSLDGRSIADTAVQLEDVKSGALCSGTITSLDRSGFTAGCTFPGGSSRTLSASWRLGTQHVAGTLRLRA